MNAVHAKNSRALQLPSDRSFGIVTSVFFALVAGLPLLSGKEPRYWALVPVVLCATIASVKPVWLHRANVIWTRFGALLQRITNPVIMAVLFYMVLFPFGMVARMCGKELLQLKFSPEADSYWVQPDKPEGSEQSMTNQF